MNAPLTPEEIERLAHRRANAKMGWYLHATIYIVVNLLLFALSEFGIGHRVWSVKPLLGWGVGLTLHGIAVFMLGAGTGLRERLVQKERERLQRRNDAS